jgi:lipid A 3-O-deacylase
MSQRVYIVMVLVGAFLLLALVRPGVAQNRGAFSFYLENDVFAGTDRYYTHGVKLTWISPYKTASRSDPLARSAISLSIGQNIYTPYDIEREDLIEDDRPYAGILFFTLALHRKRNQTMDTFELLLGIVGPGSLAAKMQRFIHSLYRGTRPQGWPHQLKNEVVFDLVFDKKWRIFRSGEGKKIEFDLIGHIGGSLGNMMTAAATGWQFRFGSNIPRDFGSFLLRPGGESGALFCEQSHHRADAKRSGAHGYLYLVGHAVYRNIFLDGNTFKQSHRVDKYSFVGDIVLGFVINRKRFRFSYAYVYRTKQFKTQTKPQIFGAINISYVY